MDPGGRNGTGMGRDGSMFPVGRGSDEDGDVPCYPTYRISVASLFHRIPSSSCPPEIPGIDMNCVNIRQP